MLSTGLSRYIVQAIATMPTWLCSLAPCRYKYMSCSFSIVLVLLYTCMLMLRSCQYMQLEGMCSTLHVRHWACAVWHIGCTILCIIIITIAVNMALLQGSLSLSAGVRAPAAITMGSMPPPSTLPAIQVIQPPAQPAPVVRPTVQPAGQPAMQPCSHPTCHTTCCSTCHASSPLYNQPFNPPYRPLCNPPFNPLFSPPYNGPFNSLRNLLCYPPSACSIGGGAYWAIS